MLGRLLQVVRRCKNRENRALPTDSTCSNLLRFFLEYFKSPQGSRKAIHFELTTLFVDGEVICLNRRIVDLCSNRRAVTPSTPSSLPLLYSLVIFKIGQLVYESSRSWWIWRLAARRIRTALRKQKRQHPKVVPIIAYEHLPGWLRDAPQWSSWCTLSFFDWRQHQMKNETRGLWMATKTKANGTTSAPTYFPIPNMNQTWSLMSAALSRHVLLLCLFREYP